MIIIGSDHAGVDLKNIIKKYLDNKKIEYKDVTDYIDQTGDDYPDVAKIITIGVLKDKRNFGIAICGTGIGISIACNKIKGIRAALCTNSNMAELARKHNNANILCLGARLDGMNDRLFVEEIVKAFLQHSFEGGRHVARLEKIVDLENTVIEGEV